MPEPEHSTPEDCPTWWDVCHCRCPHADALYELEDRNAFLCRKRGNGMGIREMRAIIAKHGVERA